MTTEWLLVGLMILFSAFFSGSEIAFLTANKLRIELQKKRNIFPGQILAFFMRNSNFYISTMLVGNCIALVVFSIFMAKILDPHLLRLTHSGAAILISKTIISTIIILVTAEFLPKNLFRINPNRTLQLFAIPLIIIYWILFPIVFIINGVAGSVLRIFLGKKLPEDKPRFGKIDLDHYVREGTPITVQRHELENEVKIFKRALAFPKVKARDCMVPRNEIVAVEVDSPVEALKKMFIEYRLSKILVYRKTMDDMIGYTHSFEIFKNPENITAVMLPMIVVPETMPANEVMTKLLHQHKSVALVVDEFGGTSGMVTMEDIIEEIFGEIEDEHDKEEMTEKKISENEFVFSGRLEIDYLNEKYRLTLPQSDHYSTLGGLILHVRRSLPHVGETIHLNPYRFKVINTTETTIEQVELRIVK